MSITSRLLVAGIAVSVIAAGTHAAPPSKNQNLPPLGVRARAGHAGPTDGPGWSDNFDSYAVGPLTGLGGWAPWCQGGSDGLVSTAFAASAPNAFRAASATDMVRSFTGVNSGKWVFKCMTYVPSSAAGQGYVIVMNTYCPAVFTNDNWSITMELNRTSGLAGIYANGIPNGATLPLLTDQWVEYRAEFDLTADTLKEFYNGTQFPVTAPQTWTGNVLVGGALNFAAIDLYSATMDGIHYDNLSLAQAGCYPDCNLSLTLTVADFGCFQTKFILLDPYADCDASTTFTVADFGCFQTKFVLGCP